MLNSGTYVSTGPVEVSQALQDGEKFIKWDDDSYVGTPVTMRVDPNGFFLYWVDQNNEMDMLDIASIRDVRTGQYAKKPKDPKLSQIVTLGSQDTLEEKTVTVCHGSDFVNISFINFCCTKKEIAQHWCDGLMRLAYSLMHLNGSINMFLKKAHTKLCLQVDKSGSIPVKNIVKMFAQNKDDRKRVEKALENTGLPSGKTEAVPVSKFTFEEFYNLYKNLTQRNEVEKVFDNLVGNTKRKHMTTNQFMDFLNNTQRDPRLNEILYPYADTERAKEVITQYEPNKFNAQKGLLSLDGFLRYLMSDDNPIMASNKWDLSDDMNQPLSHYFINSSHNTYLTGHQLTGKSSVEIYRQCLLAGCRCVELDFWNGRTDEPVIVHGYTFVPEIFAKDVLEAIAESAFKTSELPVVLSFENHCNPRQQAKIANYCREIFGEMLLDKPLDSHPLEPNVELPPPSSLKRKIIIKNKKKHHHHHHHHHHHKKSGAAALNNKQLISANSVDASNKTMPSSGSLQQSSGQEDGGTPAITTNGDIGNGSNHAPPLQQLRQSSKDSTGSSDTDSSSDDESLPNTTPILPSGNEPPPEKAQKETEAGAEISALVNYVQPIHFSSFENSEKKNRCYEMSSFDEKQATTLLKERPIEFVNYNKHQLSRVYPAGTRFDSSNFMPQLFWNAGCQLVALNFQTLDLAMQLNLGIFEYNGRSGYLLKPEFMRRTDRRLDPFAESTVDGIIAGSVSITVLSGQFLSDKRIGSYVEVDMFGLPADTVRKRFRTKIVRDNGLNPVYDEEPFIFKKVVLPALASIRIAAYEEGGKFIGHRVLPVIGLRPGYRHLSLRNELGQPLPLTSLFLCIIVKDYVPDDIAIFAEALANPIKYQNELEKRDKQLAVLQEDTEPILNEEDVTNSCGQKKELRPVESSTISPKHRSSISASAALNTEVSTSRDTGDCVVNNTMQSIQHQHSLDSTAQTSTSIKQIESSQFDVESLTAEPLDKILEHKTVREKRLEMEKKLDTLRKKHDKEKVKITGAKSSPLESSKKTKFASKLVKRISNKNLSCLSSSNSESSVEVPPCVRDVGENNGENSAEAVSATDGSVDERMLLACRQYIQQYQDIQKKYHEIVYTAAEKVLQNSQESQNKQLKSSLDRVNNEIMHQLKEARKIEVKNLALVHKDKDELVRMKREVRSSVVERGVAERSRLMNVYEQRTEELRKQHESVRNSFAEHKTMALQIMEKEFESRTCVATNGFLTLFQTANTSSSTSNEYSLQVGSRLSGISPARSNTSISNNATTAPGVTT
ncbi:1-phosphatidylinositol 4,5-bisphosphate phosphodiesterase classes I and II isoform X2 [Stomoxys calcitrans]|uniref:1-phosphatidylinositol 4,5-bisphosphate phosphodiesterase n=1 Tax=Stomoxys calcitrans TaxID=35570 RepID=A0A1I8NX66_STOCA|nr:1-phosphatidylinositol 4,5-bisphosphate phosphodiesterase classes I and II isoform X2 [Stomoxys calcitrans]